MINVTVAMKCMEMRMLWQKTCSSGGNFNSPGGVKKPPSAFFNSTLAIVIFFSVFSI